MLSSRLINAATLLVVLGTAPIAKADIATDWNRIAVEATAVPPNSILQSRVLAITHAAMYDAARLINQKPALFVTGIQPDGPSSLEAAVAAAAHTVLKTARARAIGCGRRRLSNNAWLDLPKDPKDERPSSLGRLWPTKLSNCVLPMGPRRRTVVSTERWARPLSIDPATLHAADPAALGRGQTFCDSARRWLQN